MRLTWLTVVATLVFWPSFYIFVVEGLVGTPWSVWLERNGTMYAVAIIGALVLQLVLLVHGIGKARGSRLHAAFLSLFTFAYAVAGALFNGWVVSCYAFGQGCI